MLVTVLLGPEKAIGSASTGVRIPDCSIKVGEGATAHMMLHKATAIPMIPVNKAWLLRNERIAAGIPMTEIIVITPRYKVIQNGLGDLR